MYSHAEGSNTSASGNSSHSEGNNTKANGLYSHAEGNFTTANGDSSHAEGKITISYGNNSHAEGDSTIASGISSHAEGKNCVAKGDWSHVEGNYSIANGHVAHVEGNQSIAVTLTDDVAVGQTVLYLYKDAYLTNRDLDFYKHCIVQDHSDKWQAEIVNAEYEDKVGFKHNERLKLTLSKPTERESKKANQSTDLQYSNYFYTWDFKIISLGALSSYGEHVEGLMTIASGSSSHAEGSFTMALGDTSHAEGLGTKATNSYTHAEGYNTGAINLFSHSEGNSTIAAGKCSHSEGILTQANADYSHAEGQVTIANNEAEHACGKFNKTNTNQIFSIGIGGSDADRKNAISVNTYGVISSDIVLTNGATSMTGLKISGGVEATSGMIAPIYLNSSDERLKKNIEEISNDDINKVKNIDLKSFEFKSDNSKHYGVIAQDVENVGLSELVATDVKGIKSVDYMSLLILKIAELESEIKDLKKQINK